MFCQNCGKELNEGAKFCANCGAAVNGNAPVTANADSFVENILCDASKSNDEILLKKIRVIPFALLFVAFFLPLFSISCSEVSRNYSVYAAVSDAQDLDNIGSAVSSLAMLGAAFNPNASDDEDLREMNMFSKSAKEFKVVMIGLVVLAGLGLILSFFNRIVTAIVGFWGFLDVGYVLVVCFKLPTNGPIQMRPEVGFYVCLLLFLTGACLNLVKKIRKGN